MELHWLAVLGCLSVLACPVRPAAVSTQDTLVVARSDDATTEAAVSEAAVVSEATVASEASVASDAVVTEGPVPPIKLTEMEVISEVSLRYAHTVVVARVRNPAKRAQEANFRVLLPETAFISGFVMTLDGKSYKAYVKEKEEAKQIYDQAVSQGFGAAHVAAKARDSNQFVVSVNIEASSTAVFNLTYEEMLGRRNDVYNHAINLHPGALVPKLSVTVHIKEAQKITVLRVPEVRTGNEIDATKDDAQNSKAVITRGHDDREATITFKPDLEEQTRLMQTYAKKSKESASNTHRWNQPEDTEEQPGVLGQFVVQYDVERPKDGEILVNDGYFVHFFAPSSLPPLGKYVVFVLDTSGSMMDRKIVQLRQAMQTILSDLNPGDYFSIVEFASSVTIHELKEAAQEPPKRPQYYWGEVEKTPTLVPPSPATPDNIDKAKVIVSRLSAAGGTNIDSALDVAVNLIHKRTEWGKKKEPANDTAAASTQPPLADSDADLYNIERMKTLEPIIIFLTDGDPTVGITSTATIINRLTEKNHGEDKATIFSLAFGEDADRSFLRKLSLRSDGFMRHIYEAADAALQLRDFYRQVSSPLLADVKFVYPPNQVKEGTLTKNKFRTFYAGSEVVVAGQVADDVTELTPQILGFCGVSDGVGRKRYEKLPKAPVPAKSEPLPLERLWSYLTIKQLLDERDASEGDHQGDKENSPEKRALALALKYGFVTPLTSLVVVKPNATKAVDAESVDKPTSLSISPQSINYGSAAGHPGFAYSSMMASLPGAPQPGAALAPAYSSEALSLDSLVEEEFDQYDQEKVYRPAHNPGIGYHDSSFLVGSAARHSYPSIHGLSGSAAHHSYFSSQGLFGSAARHSYPSSHGLSGSAAHHSYFSSQGLFGSAARHSYPSSSLSAAHHSSTNYFGRPPLADRFASSSVLSGSTMDLRSSLDSYDDLDEDVVDAVPTTPVVSTSESPIARYRLQEFRWTEALLNATADALTMEVNGTNVDLKLSKDTEVPKRAGGDAACEGAVDGGAGACVYLTRCEAAKHISVDTYKTTYCSINEGYAGVCCSLQKVDYKVTAR